MTIATGLLRRPLGLLAMTTAGLFFFTHPGLAGKDKIKIAATTTTLASLAREITGSRAEIHAIASPYQNIHYYQPTPKDVVKVKKADVLVHGGLDLEMWCEPMIVAAGNLKFIGAAPGAIDASQGVKLLEVPASLSRAEGDIHLYGNPHYGIDPENGKRIADNIAEGLAKIFPEDHDFFRKNADEFIRKLDEKMRDWTRRMAPYQGTPVVTYHKNWSYFAQRFGLIVLDQLEPKPGIPPTPKHMAELVRTMKEKGVKIIIKEPYQESRTPKRAAEETGAAVLTLVQAVGEAEEASDYSSMIEYDIRQLEGALGPKKEKSP